MSNCSYDQPQGRSTIKSIPDWVRTSNLRLRRPTRYPIAPRGREGVNALLLRAKTAGEVANTSVVIACWGSFYTILCGVLPSAERISPSGIAAELTRAAARPTGRWSKQCRLIDQTKQIRRDADPLTGQTELVVHQSNLLAGTANSFIGRTDRLASRVHSIQPRSLHPYAFIPSIRVHAIQFVHPTRSR